MYDVAIIGSGPAGLTAAIYAKRAGLTTIVISASPVTGGQILNTYEVDNYPGLKGISGLELGHKFGDHAIELGAEFARGRIQSVSKGKNGFKLATKKGDYEAKTVVLAMGSSNKKLGCKGEDELCGMGVSYCATCDGAFFKDKTVAVVGGGDVALEDALYMSKLCKKVYLIHRRDEFRGAAVLQEQVKNNSNIEIIYNSTVSSIDGNGKVESIIVNDKITGEAHTLYVEGVFIAVGTSPNTTGIVGLPECDGAGYIVAQEMGTTSIPGVFAAGDVRTKALRQVITACADGANCITSVQNYLAGL
ncbi:MAG: thioredoxin-disulfide reductase [Pseudobutyrivibrio sp.]|nr:thioredoxin-disulfide reductase [Pseudobutyrivibrio sp.]